jgi:hypothetical protein
MRGGEREAPVKLNRRSTAWRLTGSGLEHEEPRVRHGASWGDGIWCLAPARSG